MLQYLSGKFYQEPQPHSREPRAALFLNRFTRTSSIMFATGGVSQILGVEPEQLTGKSFYYCIAESCLGEAVKCLESAKSNDSIAYLRFWYRNPLQTVSRAHSVVMDDDEENEEDDDGGVRIRESSRSSVEMRDATPQPNGVGLQQNNSSNTGPSVNGVGDESAVIDGTPSRSRVASEALTGHNRSLSERIANEPPSLRNRMVDLDRAIEERVMNRMSPPARPSHGHSSFGNITDVDGTVSNGQSSSGNSTDLDGNARDAIFDRPELQRSDSSQTSPDPDQGMEIEAVISCTSDGLVVVLRKAHPLTPHTMGAADEPYFANGLFASPWAPQPVMPPQMQQTTVNPDIVFPGMPEPAEAGFMAAIRDVAVFAWSLTGINGSLTQYGYGQPSGEALPPGGLPVWDPNDIIGPKNDAYNGFSGSRHRPLKSMGYPSLPHLDESSSSEDEVVWKREPTMSAWRRPKRRAHHDAFGEDGVDGIDGQGLDGSRKRPSKDSSSS